MKLSIVLSTHKSNFNAVAFKENFEENIKRISELGYDGVELSIRDPELIEIDKLKEIISKFNLMVPAIGTGQAYFDEGLSITSSDKEIRELAINRLKKQIIFASYFDAIVIIGLIRGSIEKNGIETKKLLIDSLNKITEFAQSYSIRIVIEPINRYETNLINNVDQTLDILEKVNNPYIGILFDTFHANIEEPSIFRSIKNAGSKIFHIHIADSNRLYPGAGHIDFKKIIKILRGIDYKGWLSAEILPQPSSNKAAELTIKNIKKIINARDKTLSIS